MSSYIDEYNKWSSLHQLTAEQRSELESIANNEQELQARFSKMISFGTAGLRGKMQLGTNAMNVYTVSMATTALAVYIKSIKARQRKVVIAYDCRINSKLFARTCAEVLAGNGICCYIFDDLRPTPELSFAVRHLGCIAGINITASHNPKQYNGYKAYWEDGAQLSTEQAAAIAGHMQKADITDIRSMPFETGVKNGMISIIGKEIDTEYLDAVVEQAIDLSSISSAADDLKIVYTPLHGAGYRLIPEILSRIGIKHVCVVPSQQHPDGEFPTTPRPNPEYPEVFSHGINLANQIGSDLIIATDPDADRVGIMVRSKNGDFDVLNGNQTGALLLDYIAGSYVRTQRMPLEPYAVKTIVTTELMSKICREYNIQLHNVLTGFKYIGEVIKQKQACGHGTFLFGGEESYGYLKGTYARDKDAVVATMLICEMTAYYKLRGMTLSDALDDLYDRYGYSLEKTQELLFEGYNGSKKMQEIMSLLRNSDIRTISGVPIENISDYLRGTVVDMSDGQTSGTGLPFSDVLRYGLKNGDVIIVRPSGTEPKIKIYYLISANDKQQATLKLEEYMHTMAILFEDKE